MESSSICEICDSDIRVEARGGKHPSPGDHDIGPHVVKAYGLKLVPSTMSSNERKPSNPIQPPKQHWNHHVIVPTSSQTYVNTLNLPLTNLTEVELRNYIAELNTLLANMTNSLIPWNDIKLAIKSLTKVRQKFNDDLMRLEHGNG